MKKIVTVGIPVYNNAETLGRAIVSVLNQSYDFVNILVSDDGSCDESALIAQKFEEKYPDKIRVCKQKSNLYYLNFLWLVENTSSPYFCWLAGDDYMHPEYLKRCVQQLESDKSLVCCVAKCQFSSASSEIDNRLAKGTYSIENDVPSDRIASYLIFPSDNTRMYGVFRREVLLASFPKLIFHAYDWALSANTLIYGKHKELDFIGLYRDKTESYKYNLMVSRDASSALERIFPLWGMTKYLFHSKSFPRSSLVVLSLWYINIEKFKSKQRQQEQFAYKLMRPLLNFYDYFISWRCRKFIRDSIRSRS